jgi:hypothetical protein
MMLICGVETSVLTKKTKKLCWSLDTYTKNVNKYKLVFTKKKYFNGCHSFSHWYSRDSYSTLVAYNDMQLYEICVLIQSCGGQIHTGILTK